MSNPAYGLGFHAFFGAYLSGISGNQASDLVPSVFPVAIDGNPYMLDLNNPSGGNLFRRDSIALLRTQADNARTAGESSVSPEIFWRRAFDSWHLGCGQTYSDRETSSPYRFRSSKGINPWTSGQISSLNDTEKDATIGTGTNVRAVAAGSRLYAMSGDALKYTTSTSGSWSWTSVANTPTGTDAVGIASDGKNVWIAYPSAVYKTDTSSSTATSFSTLATGSWTGIWFNKGKLFASDTVGKVWEIPSSGNEVLVIDRSALGMTWTAADGVGGYHYFGGYNGDKSLIFKVDLSAEGTSLTAGIVAGELPDGELVYHIGSYLGYLIIGTSKGVRFCNTDQYGYITIGGLIDTNQPVYATEGQDRFVWFSWGNYDSVSSGLGRMDLANFTATLTPAYASDLMATGTSAAPISADVLSIATYNGKRVFTVKGKGLYKETSTAVASAELKSGLISHGIIDNKVAAFLNARMSGLAATSEIALSFSIDGEAFVQYGASVYDNLTNTPDFYIGKPGRNFEIKIGFTNSVTCTGVLLKSYPAPKRSTKFAVPIMLFDRVNAGESEWFGDPGKEYKYLHGLHDAQLPFTYNEGGITYTVVMDDYTWLPEKKSDISGFQGTFVATLREIL